MVGSEEIKITLMEKGNLHQYHFDIKVQEGLLEIKHALEEKIWQVGYHGYM